ncbi:protein of unknown function (plasmid) [Cupriavidus taiwanensis]|uniref:Uncharacterized protein n=1 Tax=Cupriavidus taiwanensis TaxID=164546 RepID=A0A375IR98_9BURK|nr:protein of unknown function [Cupriavidus taiwanensis]
MRSSASWRPAASSSPSPALPARPRRVVRLARLAQVALRAPAPSSRAASPAFAASRDFPPRSVASSALAPSLGGPRSSGWAGLGIVKVTRTLFYVWVIMHSENGDSKASGWWMGRFGGSRRVDTPRWRRRICAPLHEPYKAQIRNNPYVKRMS